jgi:hypothetical protein
MVNKSPQSLVMKMKDTKVTVVKKTTPKEKTTPKKNVSKKSSCLHDGQLRRKNWLWRCPVTEKRTFPITLLFEVPLSEVPLLVMTKKF